MQDAAQISRFRANPTKELSKSLPIRASFGYKNPTDLEEVLKKVLKDSLKLKKIFFNKDFTQTVQLKILVLKQEMTKMKN